MDCNLNTKETVTGSEIIKVCDAESGTYRNITPELIKNYLPKHVLDLNLSGSVLTISYSDGSSKNLNLP